MSLNIKFIIHCNIKIYIFVTFLQQLAYQTQMRRYDMGSQLLQVHQLKEFQWNWWS